MSINTQFILYKLQIVFFLFFGVITYAQKVDNVTLQTERDSHFTQSNPSFFHSHQETESGVLINGFSIIKSKILYLDKIKGTFHTCFLFEWLSISMRLCVHVTQFQYSSKHQSAHKSNRLIFRHFARK